MVILASEGAGSSAWRDRAADGADRPMAAGSAFKLLVPRAYEDAVARGDLGRADVTLLTEADRSLPLGVLQTLRPGTPVALKSLAGLMIQHSDNTATDALMRVLSTEALEAISPRNRPFLTTVQFFKFISAKAEDRRAADAGGDVAGRRAILKELADDPLPEGSDIQPHPTWGDAEWRITARELCDLLASLREAPALNGRPEPLLAGLLKRDGWSWVGFKGGSGFGVLNLSAAGITPYGRTVCAVLTANGEAAQPEDRLAVLFAAMLRSLANWGSERERFKEYPKATSPPIQRPLLSEAAILSRMRSAVTSRSNCAKLRSMFSVRPPMEAEVLGDCVTEAKDAPALAFDWRISSSFMVGTSC